MGLARGVLLAAVMVAASCGAASADVGCVQKELVRIGYDPGLVDGAMGGKTLRAARDFQRAAPFLDDLSKRSSKSWCETLQSQPVNPMMGGRFPVDAPTIIHGSREIGALAMTPILGVTPEYQLPKWLRR